MKTSYQRLFPYALRQWRGLSLIALLTIITSILTVAQPWPMKILVDSGLKGLPVPTALRNALVSLGLPASASIIVLACALGGVALFVINSALDAGLTLLWAVAGQRMVFALTYDLFHRLQRLSLLFHSRRSVGDSLTRLTVDTWAIYTLTAAVLITPVQQIILLTTMGAVTLRLDRQLALVSLGIAPLLAASSLFFGRRLKRRAHQARQAQSRVTAFVQQALSSIPVVQSFGMETRNRRRLEELSQDVIRWSQRGVLIGGTYGIVNGLITTGGMAVIMMAGAERVLAGKLSIGGLLVFLSYIKSMQQASAGLLQMYGSLKPIEASVERVLEILDTKERVLDSPRAKVLTYHSMEQAAVRFERVTFGYDAERPVLHDINFEVHPGEVVAFVGATGAGKSTLISLIPRFFDPWSGRITFNGIDIREVRLASLREQISLVLQEPFLLPLTIAENIAYGRPDASRSEIIAAAEAANADEFIRRLANGYDTEIGERGSTLSGGQRQRIAIARALLKSAPILILDEPTSALDARTEALLLDALERLVIGRTTFIIAHRLSTVRRANRIIVLEHGKIVESGTHDELLASGGLYHRLHVLQFRDSHKKLSA